MEQSVSITFRGIEASAALKEAIDARAGKLEKFYDKIESCRVVVEVPHRHREKGNLYHVRVRLTVPGEEIVVSRDPKAHAPHQDLQIAINDAFREAQRRLEDYVRRRRRRVKTHVQPPLPAKVGIVPDES